MGQRPSQPDDPWERSLLKGLDAFFAQEHERETSPSSPAPRPDPKEPATGEPSSELNAVFAPQSTGSAARAPGSEQSDPELEAMLAAFEKHADPPEEPQTSAFHRITLPEDRSGEATAPVLVRPSEGRKREPLSAIAEGLGA